LVEAPRILLTMRALYPAEALLCSLEFPFAAGPSHRVETAQRNAITSLATLFVTPSFRARFLNHAPASLPPGGFGYRLYEGSSVLQNGAANAEIHRRVATAQFGGGIDIRRRLKLLFPIGFKGGVGDFYTLNTPSFGVPVQARSTMSSSREDWLSTY
jgi:hypothetical protein